MLNRIFQAFGKEVDLFLRIKELKTLGYEEEDMYIIVQDEDNISMLKGYTDVMIAEEEHSVFERFKSFLKGQDSVIDAFNRMGLEEEEKKYYYNELKNGKLLLLVDKDYESNYILGDDGLFIPKEELDNLAEEKEEPIQIKLDTEEDIPHSIKKDIGIMVEDIEENNNSRLKDEIGLNEKNMK